MRVRTHRSRSAVRLISGVALAAGLLAVTVPARADHCGGSGSVDDDGGSVVGECHEESPEVPGSSKVEVLWSVHCAAAAGSYQPGDTVEFDRVEPLTEGDVEHLGLDPSGVYWWWNVVCPRDGEPVFMREFLVEETPGEPPEAIRDRARARLEPPGPAPASSPPLTGPTFVNVPTWLWLDSAGWVPLEASETQGVVTVTVRATPTKAAWAMGDGNLVVCGGPGVEWRSGLSEAATDCSHTYAKSSYAEPEGLFDGSVTVSWEFEWWINGAYQGVFGSLDLSSGFAVAVGEIQAVETGG